MPVIETAIEQSATLPAPPSAELAALIGDPAPETPQADLAAVQAGMQTDKLVKPPKPKNPILAALEEKAKAAAAAER